MTQKATICWFVELFWDSGLGGWHSSFYDVSRCKCRVVSSFLFCFDKFGSVWMEEWDVTKKVFPRAHNTCKSCTTLRQMIQKGKSTNQNEIMHLTMSLNVATFWLPTRWFSVEFGNYSALVFLLRWGHSGYRELYPDEFEDKDTDNSKERSRRKKAKKDKG